jgi:hypothetical protein
MSLKTRKAKSALEATIKNHMATNELFRSEFLEWIEMQKDIYVNFLIGENNEITRGKIQMLDDLHGIVTRGA